MDFNPPNYLDLGGALAAFGLIFAVYQLRKPQWDLVLKIRDKWQGNLFWILGVIGLLLVLIRVLISEISVIYLPFPFNTPLFYEVAAYIFFIVSPLSLFYFSTRVEGLFTKKTARRFYEALVWEISKTSDENINSALGVLLPNFEAICKATQERNQKGEIHKSASAIIDVILSDVSVVKVLTTKRLNALQYIFSTIEKYGVSRQDAGIGIKVFIEALSRSVETYLKTGDVPPRHINNGLSHLSEIFGDLCLTISIEEKRGMDTKYGLKDEWWALHLIANFLGHNYPFLAYQEQLDKDVAEREKTVPEADFFSDSAINAGIAGAIYKAFEQLSYIENTTDTYDTALNLLNGMIYYSEYKEGYRPPLEKRMWEQIATNVIRRYYPAALRTYLELVGYHVACDKGKESGWIGEQAERMKILLYVDLKPLLDADSEMVNKEKMKDALLPKSMSYEDGRFSYTFGFGKGEKKIIPPPPEGSTSALKDVDLEHRSLL